ncbi:Thioredoxin-like fold domain-containing protein MRL7L, chloroplastic [Vitis vinifera]|uniref:Thioredoxin-like fold domain-containing protein MRL7L, chloroplastic n=1 Tax=Vitis vinifera TaxID=29760 RepID=A0A438CBL5_VITVI|nr:Thioredoxin-like fold domain-containing protein MRL7L, chloroplastic [Vitis vinifera]
MALQNTITGFQHMLSAAVTPRQTNPRLESFCLSFSSQAFPNSPFLSINRGRRRRRSGLRASTTPHKLKSNDGDQDSSDSDSEGGDGPSSQRRMMQKLLADYPLVVEEDDPNWPEDADGRGFNLDQFFDKITIKNVKKDKGDDDNYDSEDEIVWQDDNYIRPIKDIKTAEWEETVLKDISPLIVLVHNRYKSYALCIDNVVCADNRISGIGLSGNWITPGRISSSCLA